MLSVSFPDCFFLRLHHLKIQPTIFQSLNFVDAGNFVIQVTWIVLFLSPSCRQPLASWFLQTHIFHLSFSTLSIWLWGRLYRFAFSGFNFIVVSSFFFSVTVKLQFSLPNLVCNCHKGLSKPSFSKPLSSRITKFE